MASIGQDRKHIEALQTLHVPNRRSWPRPIDNRYRSQRPQRIRSILISNFHPDMLLETIKSLVIRSKKRKDLTIQTQPLPGLIKKPKSTTTQPDVSDNGHASPHPGGVPDFNAGPLHAEQPAPTLPTSNYFPNAQNCVYNNPTVITQTIDSGGTVLQLLAQKRIPGAEVDSSARDPPPKCHPDTRKSLRSRIVNWVNGPDRHWRMLWIIGPMGVGKSAIAQTIAEELNFSGRLGATLFFSRPNHRDDPEGVIPTLVYQLAVKIPEYKRIITQRLADDATILEKNRRTQFRKLIIEPFHILMTQYPHVVREPLLIILDGLDECRSKEAQCELAELVGDHVRQVDEFPLLWMICSRPEWHLKGLLSHPDFQVTCQREEIFIDDDEAQQDVACVLEAGFQDIRRRYYDHLDANWPPETDVRRISVTASGHFAFASTIIKFVGDQYRADPPGQLNICIRFLGGSGTPGAVNPLHALDLLYREILSDVPRDILPTTMRILGLSILYPFPFLAAFNYANFLGLNRVTFYRSLQHLHSVLDVPAAIVAHHFDLHFYHASFADYLSDPLRSGSYSINRPAVHFDVAIRSLKWQKRAPYATETKQDRYSASHPKVEWVHSEVSRDRIALDLWDFSSSVGWRACCHVSDEDVPRVVSELEHFDFRDIGADLWKLRNFGDFLAWLYKLGDRNNSLICVEMSTDPATQDTQTLSIRHSTYDVEGYLSGFGCRDTTSGTKLRLRLGRPHNTCSVELTVVTTATPFIPPLRTPTDTPPLTPLYLPLGTPQSPSGTVSPDQLERFSPCATCGSWDKEVIGESLTGEPFANVQPVSRP